MDEISIKLLDALFDLCEGESYVILEKEELTSRISYYNFAADELTEILEALSVEGFIDLKYADNREFCVAMRTKGRTLIKQARERMQRMAETDTDTAEEIVPSSSFSEEIPLFDHELEPHSAAPIPESAPASEPLKQEDVPVRPRTSRRNATNRPREDSDRDYVAPNLARGYAAQASLEESEEKNKRKEKKMIVAAALGAAAGSLLINLIFLIIFFVKFAG